MKEVPPGYRYYNITRAGTVESKLDRPPYPPISAPAEKAKARLHELVLPVSVLALLFQEGITIASIMAALNGSEPTHAALPPNPTIDTDGRGAPTQVLSEKMAYYWREMATNPGLALNLWPGPGEEEVLDTPERANDLPQIEPGVLLVGLQGAPDSLDLSSPGLDIFGLEVKSELTGDGLKIVSLSVPPGEEAEVKALLEQAPYVAFVELNPVYLNPETEPNTQSREEAPVGAELESTQYNQWALQLINADGVDVSKIPDEPPAKITIAFLGTGVDLAHPEFTGRASGDPFNGNPHETYMAGIAAAAADGRGIDGVAPEANILSIRVADEGGFATAETIASGIVRAVEEGARVINLPYAGKLPSQTILEALRYAERNDVLVVMSSGNKGWWGYGSSVEYPARYSADLDNVLSVGAVNRQAQVTGYSGRQTEEEVALSVVAPGGIWSPSPGFGERMESEVITTAPEEGYETVIGTSAAAAHVAGLAARIWEINPQFTASQIRDIVHFSAQRPNEEGWSLAAGHGLIDVKRALELARQLARQSVNPVTIKVVDQNRVADIVGETVTVFDSTNPAQVLVRTQIGGEGRNASLNLPEGVFPVLVEREGYAPTGGAIEVKEGSRNGTTFFLDSSILQSPAELILPPFDGAKLTDGLTVSIPISNLGGELLTLQACLRPNAFGEILVNSQNLFALPNEQDIAKALTRLGVPYDNYSYDPRWEFNSVLRQLAEQGQTSEVNLMTELVGYGYLIDYPALTQLVEEGAGAVIVGPYVEQFPPSLAEAMGIYYVHDRQIPQPNLNIDQWIPDHPLLKGVAPSALINPTAVLASRSDLIKLDSKIALAIAGYTPTRQTDTVAIGVVDEVGKLPLITVSTSIFEYSFGKDPRMREQILQLWRNIIMYNICRPVAGLRLDHDLLSVSANGTGELTLNVSKDFIPQLQPRYLVLFTNDPQNPFITVPIRPSIPVGQSLTYQFLPMMAK